MVIILIVGIGFEYNKEMLINIENGGILGLVTIICFIICLFYKLLLPIDDLPNRIPKRSHWALAYRGEWEELKKLQSDYTPLSHNTSNKTQNKNANKKMIYVCVCVCICV